MVERLLRFDGLTVDDVGEAGVERARWVLGRAFPDLRRAAVALEETVRAHRPWTEDEEELVRAFYPDTCTKKLARAFRRPITQIYQRAARLGLHKSAAYLAGPDAQRLRRGDHVGAAFYFSRGHTPWNKGKKLGPARGPARGRAAETTFKPGNVPDLWMPIGAVREINGYLYLKVSDVRNVPWTVNWMLLHHFEWEAHHGRPVPEGHRLSFRDGNPANCTVENLELLTLAENMARNTIHRYPETLKEGIRLVAKLKRTIKKVEDLRDGPDPAEAPKD